MRHRSRFLDALVVVALGLTGVIGAVVSAAPASAATTTKSTSTSLAGSAPLERLDLTTTSVLGIGATATVDTSLDWSQAAMLVTQYDTDAVRQGRSLDPVDSYERAKAGRMLANWSVNDLTVAWSAVPFPLEIGTVGLSAVGDCDLRTDGPDYVCHLESDPTIVADTSPFPGIYVRARVAADVTVTPQGIATVRTLSLGGSPAGTANLSLGESSIVDTLSIPCSATSGDGVGYSLGALATTPGISVQTMVDVEVGTSTVNPDFPATDPVHPLLYHPATVAPFPAEATTTSIAMAGSGANVPLGPVQPSDTPPIADAGGPYTGAEGSPITFDGSGSGGGCGPAVPTLQWAFSDGGTATGVAPRHTFTDNGTYSGELTVTDGGGLSSTMPFTVTVTNLAPSVKAGADVTTAWGATVAFAGQATDPSVIDQSSLQYSWNFGDGSGTGPSGSGDASHMYATPGANGFYDATLTVCDKDGDCSSDVRRVSSSKRTYLVYLGDFIGRVNRDSDVRALLVDQSGTPLPGRTVVFQLGTQSVTATTNGYGLASTKLRPTQRGGLYALTAKWTPGGTDVGAYTGSSMTVPFLLLRR